MRQTVTVLSLDGNKAKVAYDRPTACHNDCSRCEGGCGAMAAKERVVVTADNPIGARAGDRVDVVFTPQINEFRSRRSVQLVITDLRSHRENTILA